MSELETRKRELLRESDLLRQDMAVEISRLENATAWISRTLHYARLISPIAAFALPLAGWVWRKRRASRPQPQRKSSLLSKAVTGYRIARQVKPLWDGFRRARFSV